jgi:hypothetical protein
MAAWQVDFYVVPKRALAAAPPVLTADVLAHYAWWSGVTLPADYRDRLTATVAPARPWASALEAWGTEDGNCIEVWTDAGRVTRVRARVDLRRLDSKFAAGLIAFARAADSALVRADGWVTEPTAGGFAQALRGSVAWRRMPKPDP